MMFLFSVLSHTASSLRRFITTVVTVVCTLMMVLLPSQSAQAEAYCALRDPVETIQKLYPGATSHRSIVRVIDETTRNAVAKEIPPNTLHFSELGKHTLYIVFRHMQPLGYVHVRSEASDWGLVEVAWAIDTDLRIKDFAFQRCRCRHKGMIEEQAFRSQLWGRDAKGIQALLEVGSQRVDMTQLKVDKKAASLAETVVRSGLKTLVVTELAWKEEVRRVRESAALETSRMYFSTVKSVERVEEVMTSELIGRLDILLSNADVGINRESVLVFVAKDAQGTLLGGVYQADVMLGAEQARLNWVVDQDGMVVAINNEARWSDERDRSSFERLIGKRFSQESECNSRTELMALEVVTTLQQAFY